jgi:hypothetical protein
MYYVIAICAAANINSVTSSHESNPNVPIWVALIGLIGVLCGVIITGLWNYFIAKISYHNQLRITALDKRLAVHQEAYYRCAKLSASLHLSDEIERINISKECESWFFKNCLYLGAKRKEKFDRLLYGYGMDKDNQDFMNRYFYPAIKAIEEEVDLPALKKDSLHPLKRPLSEPKSP